MPTVINNPTSSDSSGVGVIVGVLVAIVLVVLFFIYALPALRAPQDSGGINVNVDLPGERGTGSGTYTPPAQ